MKYHFITFATPEYMSYAEQNIKSALTIGGFDFAKIYTMEDIDSHFKIKNNNILKQSKGAGYWIWKPYIIFKHLLELNEGDILCYNDSKYIWNKNVRDFENDILIGKNIGVYSNKPNSGTHIEKQWTKTDAYTLMNIPKGQFRESVKNTNQVWGGLILLRKSFNPIKFISEWMTYSQDDRILTDSICIFEKNDSSFIENRHDQTILSLLCKKWGIKMNTLDKSYMIDLRNPSYTFGQLNCPKSSPI